MARARSRGHMGQQCVAVLRIWDQGAGQRNRKWVGSLDTLRPHRPVPADGQAHRYGIEQGTLVSPTVVLLVARSGAPGQVAWGPGF